ncbi:YdiK family protein [Salipaludibacillus agaradhaerens]|jgi:hypothetical protein|uniref:YdiK family protein n=1 Tax=Salipaludibacillus agaradhaerens TaxID=76935 RepID=A0A9Q4G0F5_SALAG|nr:MULTISPECIES: YdiK family protein [Salipaludibacillus]MCR6109445.1 YdiK family protein [Bacillus sp. A301a_S52]UJW56604.1 YdiK family protein [Bacillus sp. A116_S68]MCR6097774.1 YdiK family protein [Salipaludibacillus agaradhaerens]MCR6105373.1 YdiK family protein [Salipaludibacillus agaradhaerens]MCR6116597.1 YdiK family protein [Salipaludibacillus agaradhaerens]
MRSPRFSGYLYFFLGTLFLLIAIQTAQASPGWDAITILLMAFAAFDYFLAFRMFAIAARQRHSKKK